MKSITVQMTNTLPDGCDVTNFQLNNSSFSETSPHQVQLTLTKPVAASSHSDVTPTTLRLVNNGDQTLCKGAQLSFQYTGSAYYSDATVTTIAASPTMTAFGQLVTLEATVAPTYSNTAPSTGSVKFYRNGSASAIAGPVNVSNGHAIASVSSLPSGANGVYAVYTAAITGTNDGPDYLDSQSPPVTVTVSAPCITSKQNVKTVTARQFICLGNGGTAQSGLTIQNGGTLIVLAGGTVNAGLTVKTGGGLIIQGGTVNAGLTSTGAATLQICAANLGGGTTVQQSGAFVLIGDGGDDGSAACGGNTITAGLKVLNNTQGVEVGGNSVSGGLTWIANSGGGSTAEDAKPELESNTISGGLTCSGTTTANLTNDGHPNSVSGPRSGTAPCTSAGF